MADTAVTAELVSRIRISDPMPTRCAACLCSAGPDVRFVDFQAAYDGGAVVEEGSMAVRESIDELHLCQNCVREAAQALDYKPDLHARHLREIKRLEVENDHWRSTVRRLQRELGWQLEAGLGEPRRRGKAS